MLDHGDIETRKMKDLFHALVRQDGLQAWRLVTAVRQLNKVRRAVTGRELDDAQPIPVRPEAEGFGINGDAVA